MPQTPEFDAARRTGRRIIGLVTCALAALAIGAASAAGNDVQSTALLSLLFCALCLGAERIFPAVADYAVSLLSIAQTALVTAAFAGHPWQLDSHMVFFAVLAVQVLLINPRVLLLSAGVIAGHHAIFSLVLPALVYPETTLLASVLRTAFHGGVVVVETAVLVFAVYTRLKMADLAASEHRQLVAAQTQTETAITQANAARTSAQESQAKAEEQTKIAQNALAEAQQNAQGMQRANEAARAATKGQADEQRRAAEKMSKVVSELSRALDALAAKDLGKPVTASFPDEFEDMRGNYNSAIASLAETVSQVATQIDQIRAEAAAISSATSSQATRSEQRTATLNDVATTMQSMESSISQAASNAHEANDTVATSHRHADEGAVVVAQAVEAMREIESSSDEIRKIVSLIEDISFQTNLLALNAGVEAARAGDAGRGFAVVATEVRALAQRSSDSANEIKTLISKSGDQVANGVALVEKSGAALEQILESVARTNTQVGEINQSVQGQHERLRSVGKTLQNLNGLAAQDAAIIEETAASMATLDDATDHLSRLVSVFEIDERLGQTPSNTEKAA